MEKCLSTEKIYDGKVVKLRVDKVSLDDGRIAEREVITHGGGAGVLAVKDGKVLLERQFRYAVGREIIEIPAGKRDEGESFYDTAKRELEEETGLIPLDLKKIGEFYPTPAYTSEVIGVFFADEFKNGKVHFDDTEDLSCFWIDVKTALEMVKNGEITDAKTVIALGWYALNKL